MGSILRLIRFYLRTLARFSPKLAGRQAYGIFSTPRTRRPTPEWAQSIMDRAERMSLDVDGVRVAAYRWPQNGRHQAPRVMLVHGWESRASRLATWVDPLLGSGFEVVAFDAPAHGESEGRRSSPLAFVRSMQALARRIGPIHGCVGHSLGGFSTLICSAAAQSEIASPEVGEFPVQRLVVIAGAESGVEAMTMFSEVLGLGPSFPTLILDAAAEDAGRPIRDFDAHRVFSRVTIPTLWLHDPEDNDVPIEAAERVAQTCPHVIFEQTKGLGHHRIARDAEVIRRGVGFLASDERASAAA